MSQRHHLLSAVAVIAGLLAASVTSVASASPTTRLAPAAAPTPPVWWALGDSYSSGEGVPGTDAGALGKGPNGEDCQRANGSTTTDTGKAIPSNAKTWSVIAYERLFGEATRQRGLTLVACTGAKIDAFDGQVKQAKEWSKVQRPDVLSFSLGGNDLGFAAVIMGCMIWPKFDWAAKLLRQVPLTTGCRQPEPELRQRVEDLTKEDGDYAKVLDQAGSTVAAGGTIIVAGYPFLTEETGRWSTHNKVLRRCAGVSSHDSNMLRGIVALFNQRLASQVAAAQKRRPDVKYLWVDLPSIYEPGNSRHGLCTSSGDEWLNGITVVGNNDFRYQRSFHPNQEGYKATGEAIERKIRDEIGVDNLKARPKADARNMTLPAGHSCEFADDAFKGPVKLTNGEAHAGPNGYATISVEQIVRADVDGDGATDEIARVTCSSGAGGLWGTVAVEYADGHVQDVHLQDDVENYYHYTSAWFPEDISVIDDELLVSNSSDFDGNAYDVFYKFSPNGLTLDSVVHPDEGD